MEHSEQVIYMIHQLHSAMKQTFVTAAPTSLKPDQRAARQPVRLRADYV